jgi:hypothetical protein
LPARICDADGFDRPVAFMITDTGTGTRRALICDQRGVGLVLAAFAALATA